MTIVSSVRTGDFICMLHSAQQTRVDKYIQNRQIRRSIIIIMRTFKMKKKNIKNTDDVIIGVTSDQILLGLSLFSSC